MKAKAALLAAILLPGTASAQTVAITGAKVVTMGAQGEIPRGTILIRDGRIEKVGADVPVPAGARVIDAGGKTVTPGFIMTGTTLSIVDLPSYGILDDSTTANSRISAAYDVQYAVNPDNPEIVDARADGVTSALVTPETAGGTGAQPRLFSGQGAVIRLSASRDIVWKPNVAILMDAGASGAGRVGGGRGAEIALLRASLKAARGRGDAKAPPAGPNDSGLSGADLDALAHVTSREVPLIVRVDRASDISVMLRVAKEENIRLVLMGASEAWVVAADIAAAGAPVILDPEENIPRGLESIAATNENAARLIAAGVKVSFMAVHARPAFLIRSPRSVVGRLVGSAKLPVDRALAALTIDAATIAGVADRTGSIEAGKAADLVIWDADPLEATSKPAAVFIGGVEQDTVTRADRMGQRYLARFREQGLIRD